MTSAKRRNASHLALAALLLLAACQGGSSPDPAADSGDSGGTGGPDAGGDGGAGSVSFHAECSSGWCRVPAGSFTMGSPPGEWIGRALVSEDQVDVTLTRSFLIQQFENTQAQWTALGLPNPSGLMKDGTGDCADPECPVGNVTWFEAVEFANRLSESEGKPRCYDLQGCAGEEGAGLHCASVALTLSALAPSSSGRSGAKK